MRTQHLLLLSSIALSGQAMTAEPKSAANTTIKPRSEASSRADAARSAAASEELIQPRPARKNRVHYTFPPPAKRM